MKANSAIVDTVRTAVTGDKTLDNHEQLLISPIVCRETRRTVAVCDIASHWSEFCVSCDELTVSEISAVTLAVCLRMRSVALFFSV